LKALLSGIKNTASLRRTHSVNKKFDMKIRFWGTRGSIPVPGKDTLKYGGNTPCAELISDNGNILILDAGTGLRALGNSLIINHEYQKNINILISHYHWDHIQGIPFFRPMYRRKNKITFYGLTSQGEDVEALIKNQMTPNYFPITMDKVAADISYEKLDESNSFEIDDFKIETYIVNHSSPTLTYKISNGGKCLIYMSDNEIQLNGNPYDKNEIRELNKELLEFSRGCDCLIHDTMYDEMIVQNKKGWGHSDNISLAYFSILADVKKLVLFHYNPEYSDDKIDLLLNETQSIISEHDSEVKCIAAQEGLEINI
jgi:phosphoribosyl 1,2-cyclic phosphodiesterase